MNGLEPIGARIIPANFGPMKGFNAHARVEGEGGDTMEAWLELDGHTVKRASFTTNGCATSMAAGAMAAHLCEGRTILEIREFRPIDVLEAMGQPDNKEAHPCADLALRTVAMALHEYARALQEDHGNSDGPCGERHRTQRGPSPSEDGPRAIRKRILVLSGKDGVGKSTVAVNLAMGFAFHGLRTGLLDADSHGPSAPRLLGMESATLSLREPDLRPVERGGLKVMSLGFALEPTVAVLSGGSGLAGAMAQIVRRTRWGELDVLVVDCPPAGDEPRSSLEALGPVDGAIIVTTPQQLALMDARRTAAFCRGAGVRILGLVENLSGFTCQSCGSATPVFRPHGGKRLAKELQVPFLGALPVDPEVSLSGDGGQPRLYQNYGFGARKAFQPILQALLKYLAAGSV